VPVAIAGGLDRTAAIFAAEVVRFSATEVWRLNTISPSCSFGLR
jgi:hypothetical protein